MLQPQLLFKQVYNDLYCNYIDTTNVIITLASIQLSIIAKFMATIMIVSLVSVNCSIIHAYLKFVSKRQCACASCVTTLSRWILSLDFIVRVIQLAIVHVCIKFSIQVKILSLLQNVIRKIFCQFRASIHFPHHVCTQRQKIIVDIIK